MKPTNVLLLNLNSPCEISKSLRGIIESSQNLDLRLQQETIESNNLLSRSESALPELVSRANPAVIFLVSSWNYLKRAQSLFPSLRSSPPSPPVVVVSDTEEPDEMFEMIKLGAADFITTPLTPTGILPRLWRLLEQTCWGETLAHRLKEKFCGTKMLIYYRLDIIPLLLPPLRDRRDDIPLLANHFLTRYAAKFNKRMRRFSPDAMQKLLLYEWPGNVREMENVIERSVALCEQDTVRSADILLSRQESATGQDSFQKAKAKVVAQFERTYIQSLLLVYEGNVTRAAKAAQKDRRALWQLIRKHEIDVQRFRAGTT